MSDSKVCACCGVDRPLAAFGVDRRSPTQRRQSWCTSCTNDARRARYRKLYDEVAAYKVEAGCIDCGYRDHPAALQFDHRPGVEKVGDVAKMLNNAVAAVWLEIAKCDVRCANCHAVKTAERREEMSRV